MTVCFLHPFICLKYLGSGRGKVWEIAPSADLPPDVTCNGLANRGVGYAPETTLECHMRQCQMKPAKMAASTSYWVVAEMLKGALIEPPKEEEGGVARP